MVKIEVPKELPKCELLSNLAQKATLRHDTEFNFFGRLDEFRQRVSGEIRQINELFPEYTPHDEQFHTKRLFSVADTIIGRDRLDVMNSAELFVLAISLYGHDWGMAVSESEKQYIITGIQPKGTNKDDFWILPDEHERFRKFLVKQCLISNSKGHRRGIPDETWREYVRQTHAYRSGERVRRFFENIDGGVADASSRVCTGHWLEFEELRNPDYFPTDFSVLREIANLRALAIYLRLIDLLDLAEDRTPYVIWKYVSPRESRSKMEWAKHRALRPVTCPPYQEGRIIRVDGSTDNHDVYAALEDFRIWCEEQFRTCMDLMARMNDPRHKLDIYHIDWRIATRGFKKISIQFNFHRERMFKILGSEIYQNDSYVFLRELLQNSIDAIRMRREVLQRRRVASKNLGIIKVNVNHLGNGDAIITWSDDGIGMDEYIVKNYFAIAGQSYYQSVDFVREGLKMDPISRFGVGILSCFMVANRIEIETFKDPYLPPPGEPLKILIPDMRRQFRIEVKSQEDAPIGTTVQIFVEGKKLPFNEEKKTVQQLNVTSYLTQVAGFVEFPIVIKEGSRKTIILHPKQDAEDVLRLFGEQFEIKQLDLRYPLEQAFLAQDIPIARKWLQENRFDVNADLGLQEYEGTFSYVVPKYENLSFIKAGTSQAKILQRGKPKEKIRLRWKREWDRSFGGSRSTGISRSSSHYLTCTVYRDGILIPEAEPPKDWEEIFKILPAPNYVVNLPKSKSPVIDLARVKLLREREHWSSPILDGHLNHVFKILEKKLLALNPTERIFEIGKLIAFKNISGKKLWKLFQQKYWPIAFLEPGGRLKTLEWQKVASDTIYATPKGDERLRDEVVEICKNKFTDRKEYKGPLTKWVGERCLITFMGSMYDVCSAIEEAGKLWRLPINTSHSHIKARFLNPAWKGNPPLIQEIFLPIIKPKKLPDFKVIIKKAVDDPTQLNLAEIRLLIDKSYPFSHKFPEVCEFTPPFEQSFAYGWLKINLKHRVTQAIVRLLAAIGKSRIQETLPRDQIGQLEDAFDSLPSYFFGFIKDWNLFSNSMRNIWLLCDKMNLFEAGKIEDFIPTLEEFIPGTIGYGKKAKIRYEATSKTELKGVANPLFGKVLK